MPDELSGRDPQKVWQNQATEGMKMPVNELREMALEYRSKARFEAMTAITIGVVLCGLFAWSFARAGAGSARIGFGVLCLWCVYYASQSYRWLWPDRVEADAAYEATLHAYRRALERRRDFGRRIWRRAGLPLCFLGIGFIVAPALIKARENPQMLMNVAPVLVLLAVWGALFVPMRRRQQRRLREEIEQLRGYEREER